MRRWAWRDATRTTRSSRKFSNGSGTRRWMPAWRQPISGSRNNTTTAKPVNASASADPDQARWIHGANHWKYSKRLSEYYETCRYGNYFRNWTLAQFSAIRTRGSREQRKPFLPRLGERAGVRADFKPT